MASIKFEGLDEYVKELNDIQAHTKEYCGIAIYHGADVVADSVKAAIRALPTDNSSYKKGGMKSGPTSAQKNGMISGFGIAKMRQDGTLYNVKLGFDGYNNVKTKAWPKGQPNSMIARSVESGTSFMRANRFMSKAVSRSKSACEQVMKTTFETYLTNLMHKYG